MPSQCRICSSPLREMIEARRELRPDRTMRAVASEFGVSYQSLVRHYRKHVERVIPVPDGVTADADRGSVASDPVATFRSAFGVEPLDWQGPFLVEQADTVLLKGRQVGATQSAAALAIDSARSKPGSLGAIISPSLRQSTEIAMRARLGLMDLGEKLVQDSASLLRLRNGSRILSLPGTDRSVRGYPADLLIIDEAAWVPDLTWNAARPTVIATGGRIVVQSTPGLPSGFFHHLATETPPGWARYVVRSDQVPTISSEDLERERRTMAPSLFAQEYMAEFAAGASLGALWTEDDWRKLIRPKEED